ncbi:MAG: HD domain-containing protein [Desulfuromonadaceae bacterium]
MSCSADVLKQLSVQWGLPGDHFEEIQRIAEAEMGNFPENVKTLMEDVVELYQSGGSAFEPCQVGYHTIRHALEVTLATCRMLAGWNRTPSAQPKIAAELFPAAVAAALFHDAGYLKNRNDTAGKGGKYTFAHVQRGMAMAQEYLQRRQWPEKLQHLTVALIEATEFHQPLQLTGMLASAPEKNLASMLVTADILVQISDPCYFDRLPELFAEFEEGYAFEGEANLKNRGIRIYQSAQELVNDSQKFFRQVVLPRLEELGRMDLLLDRYFGDTDHPYRAGVWQNFAYRL